MVKQRTNKFRMEVIMHKLFDCAVTGKGNVVASNGVHEEYRLLFITPL